MNPEDLPTKEQREAMVDAMAPAMGDDVTRDEMRAAAERLWLAGYRPT